MIIVLCCAYHQRELKPLHSLQVGSCSKSSSNMIIFFVTLNIEDFKSIVWWCVHWHGYNCAFLIAEMVIMAPNCLRFHNIHYICVFVRCYYSKWVMLHSFYQTFYQLHASAGNWQQEMLLIWQLAPSTYLIIILVVVVVVVFCLKFYFLFILNAFFKDSFQDHEFIYYYQ